MNIRKTLGIGALATAMAFGIACGNKTVEAPAAPVPTAEEKAIEDAAIAEAKYQTEVAAYETAVVEQQAQYTHTVTGPVAIWDLVGEYGGNNDVATIDTLCTENGMKYLDLAPEVLRWEPMTPVWEDGKQVNCNLLYEGQVLDFSYLAPELVKPVK